LYVKKMQSDVYYYEIYFVIKCEKYVHSIDIQS
jgi:hypothetical protein